MSSLCNLIWTERMVNTCLPRLIELSETFTHFTGIICFDVLIMIYSFFSKSTFHFCVKLWLHFPPLNDPPTLIKLFYLKVGKGVNCFYEMGQMFSQPWKISNSSGSNEWEQWKQENLPVGNLIHNELSRISIFLINKFNKLAEWNRTCLDDLETGPSIVLSA